MKLSYSSWAFIKPICGHLCILRTCSDYDMPTTLFLDDETSAMKHERMILTCTYGNNEMMHHMKSKSFEVESCMLF